MATKTLTTKTGKSVEIEFVRDVQDKVAYADGYNITTGREIVERTHITFRDQTGKPLARGNRIEMVDPRFNRNAAELIAKGAVARLGDAYISQELADMIAAALAELDVENPKSEEQLAIERAKAEAHARWEAEAPQRMADEAFARRMDDPNSDL